MQRKLEILNSMIMLWYAYWLKVLNRESSYCILDDGTPILCPIIFTFSTNFFLITSVYNALIPWSVVNENLQPNSWGFQELHFSNYNVLYSMRTWSSLPSIKAPWASEIIERRTFWRVWIKRKTKHFSGHFLSNGRPLAFG